MRFPYWFSRVFVVVGVVWFDECLSVAFWLPLLSPPMTNIGSHSIRISERDERKKFIPVNRRSKGLKSMTTKKKYQKYPRNRVTIEVEQNSQKLCVHRAHSTYTVTHIAWHCYQRNSHWRNEPCNKAINNSNNQTTILRTD